MLLTHRQFKQTSGNFWRSPKPDTAPCCQVWVTQVAADIRLLGSVRTDATAHHGMYTSGTTNCQYPRHFKRVSVRRETKTNICVAAKAYESCRNRTSPVLYHSACDNLLTAGITSTLSPCSYPRRVPRVRPWDPSMVKLFVCQLWYHITFRFMVSLRTQQITGRAGECRIPNKEFCVLHLQSNTTIFYLLVQ